MRQNKISRGIAASGSNDQPIKPKPEHITKPLSSVRKYIPAIKLPLLLEASWQST